MPETRVQSSEGEPTRAQLDALPGLAVLEFGTGWCGHCIAAQAAIRTALSGHPQVRHLKFEDGPGRQPGRSYRVKLWPTLVFLRDGVEVARLVRPTEAAPIRDALEALDGTPGDGPAGRADGSA